MLRFKHVHSNDLQLGTLMPQFMYCKVYLALVSAVIIQKKQHLQTIVNYDSCHFRFFSLKYVAINIVSSLMLQLMNHWSVPVQQLICLWFLTGTLFEFPEVTASMWLRRNVRIHQDVQACVWVSILHASLFYWKCSPKKAAFWFPTPKQIQQNQNNIAISSQHIL